ncbi:MAG: endolytic transglycosylase MltG [Cohaesibacter sp.]|nr:endolytic transglycosylase MltG [Cohaesibacter sp.]
MVDETNKEELLKQGDAELAASEQSSAAESGMSDREDARESEAKRSVLKAPKSPRQAIEPGTPPPPPGRSKAVRHPVIVFANFVLTVMLLAIVGIGGMLYFGKLTFDDTGPLTKEKTILVSRGTGLVTIASILEQQNVISNKHIFEYGVRLYKKDGALKAGEYLFRPGLSMHEVMNILTSGKSILHSVTIPEGYTSYQAMQVIKADPILTGDMPALPAEGALLPETYKFSRGTTRADLVKRMMNERTRAVEEVWKRRAADLPLANMEELVTLASIVEKETGQAGERTRVAGVFINRLKQGIKLQSDPTVIYGIFAGKGKPKGRPIFKSDLQNKNAYNTYHIPALTPGPIANPGRAALEAVANPSRTKDLFFVADGTGGHVFAETLKQHNLNVKRWRQIERQRIEARKKAEAAAKAKAAPQGQTAPQSEKPDAN